MKFKEIINEKLKRKYEFTLKASDLNKEVDQQLEKEQPSIQMKGFRKGKVPISLLKKMHGEALLSEAMKSATDTAVKDHFEKKGDKPAYEPKIDLINKEWKSGDDVELSIEYECMPEIPKFDLSKLVLDNLVVEPDKKSLDDAMKSVQESSYFLVHSSLHHLKTFCLVLQPGCLELTLKGQTLESLAYTRTQ